MVATYWPSTCVFNKLYLENLLVPLRHTFPTTTFSRVDDYWLVLPWGHDQSTVSVLAGYDRGHVCNLGTTLTKYFSKRQTGITVLWMLHDDVIKWKHFFALLVLCEGNPPPVNEGFPSQRPVKRSFNIFYLRMNKRLKANSRDDGASRHHRAHYDVTVNDLRNKKSQYDLSATLLAKTVYGRNLLTVCVRVQWGVSWKFIGSFTPHLSINNSYRVDILLTRFCHGAMTSRAFLFDRLWPWSRVQFRDQSH